MWTPTRRASSPSRQPTRAQANEALGLADRDTGFEADVDRVLAHIQARQRSHPDSPATGLHDMADERWQACVAALRAQGYPVTTTVVASGDRTGNETGYVLTAESAPATTARLHGGT